MLDHPKLTEQLLTLVLKSGKIDHLSGDHDDFANAAAGALVLASEREQSMVFNPPTLIYGPRFLQGLGGRTPRQSFDNDRL